MPVRADGSLVPGPAGVQAEQVFEDLGAASAVAGASWDEVVTMTYVLRDLADLDEVRAVRDRFVDVARPPASSLVQVVGLVHPDLRLEIDAVAVIDPA